jgi:ribonucleoside-diphosphate reductase beta chain
MSFQLRNLMKGTGQIVEWSVRDESLHSKAGCWLFTTLLKECP